jgi:hypothetical protein
MMSTETKFTEQGADSGAENAITIRRRTLH